MLLLQRNRCVAVTASPLFVHPQARIGTAYRRRLLLELPAASLRIHAFLRIQDLEKATMSDASFRISRRGFLNLTALGAASAAVSACT
ncbi:twin-arginine translocation signal domain-containing protein, partial [Mesorhizobium sp. M1E.F.Ca.ET.063.01.1.1]|uniref:twin-arginine translocation signal domain-containing protein n=1 Tax=Mesorhizobium sp. M1E.F.Ca.ET.063.01.1.1 TaxID=2496750 RepID=UPI001FE14208